jgi:hypothetical protein
MKDQEYYRKIPVSTPPEKEGVYFIISTDEYGDESVVVDKYYINSGWEEYDIKKFTCWLQPLSLSEIFLINPTEYRRGFVEVEQSQMEKTLLFAEFIKEKGYTKDHHTANCEVVKWRLGYFSYTTSELYNSEEYKNYLKEKGV